MDNNTTAVTNKSSNAPNNQTMAAKRNKGGGAPSVVSNKTHSSHASSKSNRSALGYQPIHISFLESNLEFVTRWMNSNVLTSNIQSFPTTIVEHNGHEIFELITFLTGRGSFNFRCSIESNMKRLDRVQKLHTQYSELIKMLKTEGALLNHIRPEFLLSYMDFMAYLKTLPANITSICTTSALKISQ